MPTGHRSDPDRIYTLPMDPDGHGLPPDRLRSVIGLMEADRWGELTVDDLADHAGYSRFHFSRLFTAATGAPPGRYASALRVDRAKRLLLTDSAPIIDIAATVGFDSLSSFGRRFQALVGVSPGRFRRLADTVADRTLTSFRTGGPTRPPVTIRPHLDPQDVGNRPMALWIGWFPHPVPFGLPTAGILATTVNELRLPLCPGNPWLLSIAVPLHADVDEHLAPSRPLVARVPHPLREPTILDLRYARPTEPGPPILPALPSLTPTGR